MGLVYSHVDTKRQSEEMKRLRDRVDDLHELAENSDL